MSVPAPVSFVQVSREDRPRVSVAYERRGSGEPLVLLHGIGHHRQAWEPVMDALAASHEVIALDLPGFGQSPALPDGGPYGAEALASVLADVFVELDLDRPHVVGNSLGGLIALHLGRAGLARSVTAFSPAGFWTEAERRWTFALLLAMRAGARALPDAALTRLARTAAGRAVLTGTVYARPARRSPEDVVAETRALRDAEDFRRTLDAGRGPEALFRSDLNRIPVTIAWGTRDVLLPRRQGVRAKRLMPGARLVRLPGCGHVPMADDPARVARVITDTAR